MNNMNKMAFPLTFLLKQEGSQWAALSPELSIASCGRTADEAREALKDAIETYVRYMIAGDRMQDMERRATSDDVEDFLAEPSGACKIEGLVLVVVVAQREGCPRPDVGTVEFVRSMLPASYAGRQSSAA